MSEILKEGWSDMRPGDRVYHYVVEGSSLCRKIAFHGMRSEDLSKHNPDQTEPGKRDCKPCFRGLIKRLESK